MDNIVVDVDGVLLNFSKPFSTWFNKRHKDEFFIHENPQTWSFDDNIPAALMIEEIEEFMKTDPVLPLIDHEAGIVLSSMLKKMDVHIITSCSACWSESRLRNLEAHKISFSSIEFTHNKMKSISLLNPFAVIEDKPSTIKEVAEKDIHVLYPSFWNYLDNIESSVKESHRVFLHPFLSWAEVPEILVRLQSEKDVQEVEK